VQHKIIMVDGVLASLARPVVSRSYKTRPSAGLVTGEHLRTLKRTRATISRRKSLTDNNLTSTHSLDHATQYPVFIANDDKLCVVCDLGPSFAAIASGYLPKASLRSSFALKLISQGGRHDR
jgi:hypothetical protein